MSEPTPPAGIAKAAPLLSVVIPAYNEEDSIGETLRTLHAALVAEGIAHEIVVTNDNSKDNTLARLEELAQEIPTLVYYTNAGPNGFGYAVRYGLERYSGDCVAVMMADLSDDPADLVRYYHKMQEGYDCVFGSRWGRAGAWSTTRPTKRSSTGWPTPS